MTRPAERAPIGSEVIEQYAFAAPAKASGVPFDLVSPIWTGRWTRLDQRKAWFYASRHWIKGKLWLGWVARLSRA